MATKATVKKKNPRWVAVLEDMWAYDKVGSPASKAEIMDGLCELPGFKVVKLTREQPVKK